MFSFLVREKNRSTGPSCGPHTESTWSRGSIICIDRKIVFEMMTNATLAPITNLTETTVNTTFTTVSTTDTPTTDTEKTTDSHADEVDGGKRTRVTGRTVGATP